MNLFEQFLISRSERHLKKYRESAKRTSTEFLQQYNSYLPDIERVYTHASYWHGTGKYQYRHARGSRIEKIETPGVVNVLESILNSGALETHIQEHWVTHDGGLKETVSLAPTRMHARLYSHIHLREGVLLEYVFGGTRFWMGFFIFLAILQFSKKSSLDKWTSIHVMMFSKNFLSYARVWASAVCNLDKYSFLPLWKAYDLRSDIAGNHGILFGIKDEATQGSNMFTLSKNLEVRVDRAIKLNDMTHIEVPRENVEETKQLFARKNISLPIIPLEFGEMYCSQFPLIQLAHV